MPIDCRLKNMNPAHKHILDTVKGWVGERRISNELLESLSPEFIIKCRAHMIPRYAHIIEENKNYEKIKALNARACLRTL